MNNVFKLQNCFKVNRIPTGTAKGKHMPALSYLMVLLFCYLLSIKDRYYNLPLTKGRILWGS